jgi:hypothetical protein
LVSEEWEEPKSLRPIKHKLLFNSQITEINLKIAIVKGMIQFYIRKYLGKQGYMLIGAPFEKMTDTLYELIR